MFVSIKNKILRMRQKISVRNISVPVGIHAVLEFAQTLGAKLKLSENDSMRIITFCEL